MKEFTVYYISSEDKNATFVGSAYGETTEEAIDDFTRWHDDCIEIVDIEIVK